MQEQYSGVARQHELLLELVMRFQNWPKAANETRLATVMLLMLAYGARTRARAPYTSISGIMGFGGGVPAPSFLLCLVRVRSSTRTYRVKRTEIVVVLQH